MLLPAETEDLEVRIMIDSVVVSWNPSKQQYTITVLTRDDGLIAEYADDIHDAVQIINKLEETHGTA